MNYASESPKSLVIPTNSLRMDSVIDTFVNCLDKLTDILKYIVHRSPRIENSKDNRGHSGIFFPSWRQKEE